MPAPQRTVADRISAAFTAACAEAGIEASVTPVAGGLRFEFADQQGIAAAMLQQHAVLELQKLHVSDDMLTRPREDASEEEVARLERAVREAVARVGSLMIAANSYLSGGLPWVFPGGAPLLRSRGLSTYRYPCRGATEVRADGEGIVIRFAAGALGTVTSSGFYVPTKLSGDFRATARYDLVDWRPGRRAASVALFAQDEAGQRRYYSQRNGAASGIGTHAALANLAGWLGPLRPVDSMSGWFCIERIGARVGAFHCGVDDRFIALGDVTDDPNDELFVGAKVWSMEECDGLTVRISELTVEGDPAAAQPPMPEVREDPRLRP
jgi:hypothetical protein